MPTRGKTGDGGNGDQQSFLEAPAPHYTGHRQRLRERFRKGGSDAMPDYELLELVLFRALPRRDRGLLVLLLLLPLAFALGTYNFARYRKPDDKAIALALPPGVLAKVGETFATQLSALQHAFDGIVSPGHCKDGSVRSDLNITVVFSYLVHGEVPKWLKGLVC